MNVLTVLVFLNERGRLVAELNVKPHFLGSPMSKIDKKQITVSFSMTWKQLSP